MFILGFIIFLIAITVCFYIPGKIFLDLLKIKLDRIDNFIFSWFLGIVIFYFLIYGFAWLKLGYIPLFLIAIVSAIYVIHKFLKKPVFKIDFSKVNKPILVTIILGSLAFSSFMFFSGWLTDRGLEFVGVNAVDGIRHMSYIKNMILHFPPEQPGLVGIELRGFHYAYDFILSRFSMYFGLTPEDLYFRHFPIFISSLYGAAFYLAGKVMKADNTKLFWILFFAFFSQSFSFLLFFINQNTHLVHHSVVQPIGLIVNPFTVLSIAFLVAGISLFTKIKDSWKYALVAGLILGLISQMKVYAGLMGIGSIVLYSAYAVFLKKANFWNFVIATATTAVVTAVTYLPNNFMSGGLLYAPLLFYRQYMQQAFFDSVLHWELRRLVFEQHNNYLRIAILYMQAIGIFMVVNIGPRMVVFLKIKQIFTKKFWKNDFSFIWLTVFIVPIFIASFYIQSSGSQFDTVQFFWISIAILSVPAGMALGDIFKKNGKILKTIIVIVVLLVTLPELTKFAEAYFLKNPRAVHISDVRLMDKVKSIVPESEYITYIPLESGWEETNSKLIIGSLTGRSTYIEPGNIPNKQYNDIYEDRKNRIVSLVSDLSRCDVDEIENKLKKIGSNYIVTNKVSICLSYKFDVIESKGSKNYYFYHLNLN